MPNPDGSSTAFEPEERHRLGPLFLAIVAVEALTILALYWFGRYFA